MKFACFICLLFVVSCGRQPQAVQKETFADSLQHAWMLHGIASAYCYANNGGKLKE